MLSKNKSIDVTITEQGKTGDGVAYVDSMPVYIPNTVAGDHLTIKIVKVEKRRAYGRITKVLNQSKDRVLQKCSVAEQCGGCQLQHLSKQAQVVFKDNLLRSRLSRYIQLDESVFMPFIQADDPWEFRNKMQFSCAKGDTENELKIGLYAARSHRVIDIDYCQIMSAEMNAMLVAIKALYKKHPIDIYDEATGQGILRYITLRYSVQTKQVMLILTLGQQNALPESWLKAIAQFDMLTSFYTCYQGSKTQDQVLTDQMTHCAGKPHIQDVCLGIKYNVLPTVFLQANAKLVETLYSQFAQLLNWDPANPLVDLYCGTGVLTQYLAKTGQDVQGVDNNLSSIKQARQSNEINQGNVVFHHQMCEEFVKNTDLSKATVILDPPRKGCHDSVLQALIKAKPSCVAMISCNPETLGRDLRTLIKGGFKVNCVQGVDMFCHSTHVEVLVTGAFK